MKHNGKSIEITFTAFPEGPIHGCITDLGERYLILIDSNSYRLQQYHALGHELAHLFLGHFDSSRPVMDLEHEANERAWEFYRAYRNGTLPA